MLSSSSFREKRIESVIAATNSLVRGHLTVRLNPMLEAEKLPTSITDLHAGLANVDAKRLTHGYDVK